MSAPPKKGRGGRRPFAAVGEQSGGGGKGAEPRRGPSASLPAPPSRARPPQRTEPRSPRTPPAHRRHFVAAHKAPRGAGIGEGGEGPRAERSIVGPPPLPPSSSSSPPAPYRARRRGPARPRPLFAAFRSLPARLGSFRSFPVPFGSLRRRSAPSCSAGGGAAAAGWGRGERGARPGGAGRGGGARGATGSVT